MKLGSAHLSVLQSNSRDALEFTPPPVTITLHQTAKISDAASDRDDLDTGDVSQNLEILLDHRVAHSKNGICAFSGDACRSAISAATPVSPFHRLFVRTTSPLYAAA